MKKKNGFTLVEMLVVIAIIGVLAAIILPAINKAREQAKLASCRGNLRNFFVSLTTRADNDPKEAYTSGAFDGWRDGSIDTYGWVADMVNAGLGEPGKMLCSSNPAKLSEKINDYLATPSGAAGEKCPTASRISTGAGALAALDLNGSGVSAASNTAVVDHFLKKGYNTNYASSFFLIRTGPKLAATDTGSAVQITYGTPNLIKSLANTLGPLSRPVVDGSPVASNLIPLLFDSNVGDQKEAFLVADLEDTVGGTVFGKTGDRMCESFSDGPAYLNGSAWEPWGKTQAVDVHDGTSAATLANSIFLKEQPPVGTAPTYPLTHLQDYRDIGPVHAGNANVLFADGSIKAFKDQNRDGYLNPGFNAPTLFNDKIGYVGGAVELDPQLIFSGVFLQKLNSKTNLD